MTTVRRYMTIRAHKLLPISPATGPDVGLKTAQHESLQDLGCASILPHKIAKANPTSRPGTCCLDLHTDRQDALVKCKTYSTNAIHPTRTYI